MLGNDLLGFHTQYHCNNFLDTVDRTLESPHRPRAVRASPRGGHETTVRPFPISVDPRPRPRRVPRRATGEAEPACARSSGCATGRCSSASTGSTTRRASRSGCRAVDRLLEQHPEYRGTFHFLQVGAAEPHAHPRVPRPERRGRATWPTGSTGEHGDRRLAAGRVPQRAPRAGDLLRPLPDGRRVRGQSRCTTG